MIFRFLEIYDALPTEAQRALLTTHLAPLIDNQTAKEKSHLISTASTLYSKYTHVPKLNLKVKKIEIQDLVGGISRDSKRSLVKERSNKDVLAGEVVDSLTEWLGDIWSLVFEFRVEFAVRDRQSDGGTPC